MTVRYTGAIVGVDYDETYRGYLTNAPTSKRMTRSAEELRIGKRLAKKGEVRVAKHVETEHVRQDGHEEVDVNPSPGNVLFKKEEKTRGGR